MTRIRFGLAGTGRMAALMMEAFHHAPEVEVCAVSSGAMERAQKFAAQHNIANAYGSLDAMLNDDTVDVVYIANATQDHAATAIAVLAAGKHALAEKPFAVSVEEGERVIAAAKRSGKLFMEGIWTLFLPSYRRVFDLLKEQAVGEPVHLYTDFAYPADPAVVPRLFDKNGGGVLLDRTIYPVAFALSAFGPIKKMDAQVTYDASGVDIHSNIQAEHVNGALSQLSASMISMMSNTASIACSEGLITIPAPVLGSEMVRIDRFSQGAGNSGGASRIKSALKQIPVLRKLKTALGAGGESHLYGANQYLPQLQHFIHLIVAQKTESDIVSHDFSLEVIRTLDRIRAAAK